MYSLFSENKRVLGGQLSPPRFHDVEKKVVDDVERVIGYYRAASTAVRTNHLLVKLIMTMNVPLAYEPAHYYDVASQRALQVANAFNLTTSIAAGKWHDGLFYHGCQERILAYTDYSRPLELIKNWWDLQPVHVLEHPVSNLSYMLPNGAIHNSERGLAVVAINVPMLMLQYRCFVQWQQQRRQEGGIEHLGEPHFVHKYVLPNMLKSQTDLVLFNRLVNLFEGRPMGISVRKHPFYLSDYSDKLDVVLNQVLSRISSTRLPYLNMLTQIPTLFRDRPLQMPDIAETQQVWWALFYTRLKAIQFLWNVGGAQGRHLNRQDVNALLIDIKRFRSENLFARHLNADQLLDLELLFNHFTKEA